MGEKSNKVSGPDVAQAVAIFLAGLKQSVKEAVAEAVREERRSFVEADGALAGRLAEINAKDNITVQEAALLLSCSDSHLYRLIKDAEKGLSQRPIPYLDVGGVKILPREQLLEWARSK